MTALVGTGRLVRLGIRRDRGVLAAWVLGTAALTGVVVVSVVGLYPTAIEREAAARFSAANPIARALDGPAAGTDLGALVAVESTAVLAVVVALMAAQAVVRGTRRDEEAGLAELLGSAVVGHHARTAAAVIVALLASLVTGLAVTVVHLSQGFAAAGSVAAGAAVAGVGAVFAAVAAVTAQLVSSARGANGLAGAAIGLAFLLRAIGDATGRVADSGVEVISAWPSWLSPIGWAQQVRPHGGDRFEVLLLALVAVVVLLAAAVLLEARRDLEAGTIPPRPGPARAGRGLRSGLGLAWRLQRSVVAAWCVGAAVLGAAFGVVGDSVEELLETTPDFAEVLASVAEGGEPTDLYLGLVVGLLAIITSGAAVQVVLRARTEELSGRLEPLLATALGRARWFLGHLGVAALTSVVVLLVLGAAGATGFGLATGDAAGGLGMLRGALAHLPAVWTLAALVALAGAVVPRAAAAIGWSLLLASLLIGQFGALFGLPEAVVRLSPFHHVPAVPVEALRLAPLAVLTGVALATGLLAVLALRRRDLALTA